MFAALACVRNSAGQRSQACCYGAYVLVASGCWWDWLACCMGTDMS